MKSWGFNKFISIERSLKEYGNDEISHNVEYSLHPVFNEYTIKKFEICICEQNTMPFAMFECKRVGAEEGCKKGPQTIEKAKQGAYVAKSVSALQKI